MSIELKGASFDYPVAGGASVSALAATDLVVRPGSFMAVLGANGSGKSTLAKMLNGLLFATNGEVWIDGRRIDRGHNDLFARRTVGLVFQNPDNQLVANVVEDDVAFGPENLGLDRAEIRRRVDRSLEAVGLPDLARQDPHRLSAGQRQRVALAGALAMEPRFLVLDEPTSLLDPEGRRDILAVLAELRERQSVGMVYITHIVEEAVAADTVLVLDKGRIIATGPPRELLTDATLMDRASLYSPKPNVLARRLCVAGLPASDELLTVEEVVSSLCSSS